MKAITSLISGPNEVTVDEAIQLAVQHHKASRLVEAEQLYRQVLAVAPGHADAWRLLGVLAGQAGREALAIEFIQRALQLQPSGAEAHSNLGDVLRRSGQPAAARDAYRRTVQLNGAIVEAHMGLGIASMMLGDLDEAIAAFQRVVQLQPEYAEAFSNLGYALSRRKRTEEAVAACRRAIDLRPGYAEAHCNLGIALADQENLDAAEAALRRAIRLKSDLAEAHNNLGLLLHHRGQMDEGIASFRRAIQCGGSIHFLSNLGNALDATGHHDEALACYRKAMAHQPNDPAPHSNYVYALHFHPDYDAAAICRENRAWGERHARPLMKFVPRHDNVRTAGRRLRIGYVSPDLRNHVVGRNVLPLLANHDVEQFELFAYFNHPHADSLTETFKSHADGWRNIIGLPDEAVARQIRDDGIDILVDLSLHMAGNRLLVFARKPAPVQASFAGYPGSTGVGAIDYRLTDPYLEPEGHPVSELLGALADKPPVAPEGMDRQGCLSHQEPPPCPPPGYRGREAGETAVRLPHSFWCFDPLECGDIPVAPLPVIERGFITFGCLNNFLKVNATTLRLWANVLQRVDGSRLLLMADDGSHRNETREFMGKEGVDPARLKFVGRQPRRQYMETYRGIDLGLDSFPYNGHTTSLESSWMGVPVVTLAGQTPVARAGWSQLSNLGLTELAASTPEQFVEIAVELAKDLPRLAELRRTLRSRMERSPLMDAVGFTQGIEAAYRAMWKAWCQRA